MPSQRCLPPEGQPEGSAPDDLQRPMVVTMVAMLVVQTPIHQVVDVVAMRHGLMPATGTVDVAGVVSGAALATRAAVRIALADLDHVLVHVIDVRMMQMAIMQVIHMTVVAHGGVAAIRPVLMVVMLVMRRGAVAQGPISKVSDDVHRHAG